MKISLISQKQVFKAKRSHVARTHLVTYNRMADTHPISAELRLFHIEMMLIIFLQFLFIMIDLGTKTTPNQFQGVYKI